MTNSRGRPTGTEIDNAREIFDDPILYLARFGIVAEVVSDTSLPAAA